MSRHNDISGPSKPRHGLFRLLSLIFLVLIHPQLDQSMFSKLVLIVLSFFPLILVAVKLSHKRTLFWIFVALMVGAGIFAIAGNILANQILLTIQWGVLAASCGLAVFELFFYVRQARAVTADHLSTAASIYLLLAALWYNLFKAIQAIHPASFQQTVTGAAIPRADLLYFSLATLTTLGYGDIVPVGAEVRMLAALEAAVGLLYVAITIAQLVSAYKPQAEQ